MQCVRGAFLEKSHTKIRRPAIPPLLRLFDSLGLIMPVIFLAGLEGLGAVGGFRSATREEVLSKSFCQAGGDEIVTVSNSQLSCMQSSICAILRTP